MSREVHLLVHAGAPSTRHNDDAYREQARSLSTFQPSTAQSLVLDEAQLVQPWQSTDGPDFLNQSTIYAEDTQTAFTALESQLIATRSPQNVRFQQQVEPIHQRPDRAVAAGDVLVTPSNDSSPASLPTHSSYLLSPVLNRTKRQPVQVSEHTSSPSSVVTGPGVIDYGSRELHPQRAPDVPTSESGKHSSELPSSYSLTDLTTENSRPFQLNSDDPPVDRYVASVVYSVPSDQAGPSIADHALQSANLPGITSGADGQVCHERGALTDVVDDAVSNTPAAPLAHDNGSSTVATTTDTQEPAITFETLPTTIHAPSPPVGAAPATTWITKHLQFLADHEIGQHYRPVSVVRDIRPSERGAWTMDTSQWPPDVQLSFWKYLQQAVGAGLAGWGVWCTRQAESKCTLGRVRVFCWGECVMHVYLLLYVASHSKVRRKSLQWIDAEEEVVVQMP